MCQFGALPLRSEKWGNKLRCRVSVEASRVFLARQCSRLFPFINFRHCTLYYKGDVVLRQSGEVQSKKLKKNFYKSRDANETSELYANIFQLICTLCTGLFYFAQKFETHVQHSYETTKKPSLNLLRSNIGYHFMCA